MSVPGSCTKSTMLNLDESNTSFDKSPRGQQLNPKIAGMWLIDSVEGLSFRGFLGKLEDLGNRFLHPKRHLIRGDACGHGRIFWVFKSSQAIQPLHQVDTHISRLRRNSALRLAKIERIVGINSQRNGIVSWTEIIAIAFVPIFAIA